MVLFAKWQTSVEFSRGRWSVVFCVSNCKKWKLYWLLKYNCLLNTFKLNVYKYRIKCWERGWTVIYREILFKFLESWIFGTVRNPFFILQVSFVTFTFVCLIRRGSRREILMWYCTVMAPAENDIKLWTLIFVHLHYTVKNIDVPTLLYVTCNKR